MADLLPESEIESLLRKSFNRLTTILAHSNAGSDSKSTATTPTDRISFQFLMLCQIFKILDPITHLPFQFSDMEILNLHAEIVAQNVFDTYAGTLWPNRDRDRDQGIKNELQSYAIPLFGLKADVEGLERMEAAARVAETESAKRQERWVEVYGGSQGVKIDERYKSEPDVRCKEQEWLEGMTKPVADVVTEQLGDVRISDERETGEPDGHDSNGEEIEQSDGQVESSRSEAASSEGNDGPQIYTCHLPAKESDCEEGVECGMEFDTVEKLTIHHEKGHAIR